MEEWNSPRYRIRQKSTGLYLCNFKVIPPLTKAGVPSKAIIIPRNKRRLCGYEPVFVPDCVPLDYDRLEYIITMCTKHNKLDSSDLELETLTWNHVPNDRDLQKTMSEIGQEVLAEKLKHG